MPANKIACLTLFSPLLSSLLHFSPYLKSEGSVDIIVIPRQNDCFHFIFKHSHKKSALLLWKEKLEGETRERSMGGRVRVLRASLGAVLFMAFIMFLFVGVLAHRVMKTTTIPTKSSELLKLIGTKRYAVKFNCDPYYVSKRRVPNGPDPIHNRRVGKYREPPGRV